MSQFPELASQAKVLLERVEREIEQLNAHRQTKKEERRELLAIVKRADGEVRSRTKGGAK